MQGNLGQPRPELAMTGDQKAEDAVLAQRGLKIVRFAEHRRDMLGIYLHHRGQEMRARDAAAGLLLHQSCGRSKCSRYPTKAPQQWRIDLAAVIAATPDLDWMLLSKRIENYRKLAPWPWAEPPPNVWIGATTENQEYFERRWRILRDIPARVTFVSYEPAMGPLHLPMGVLPDWLICGGQDGAGAKSFVMEPQWARDIRDDCLAGGTAFFTKQMANKTEIPDDLLIRQFPA
jgi:hypothetical protein